MSLHRSLFFLVRFLSFLIFFSEDTLGSGIDLLIGFISPYFLSFIIGFEFKVFKYFWFRSRQQP